jgi:hypothetical protein
MKTVIGFKCVHVQKQDLVNKPVGKRALGSQKNESKLTVHFREFTCEDMECTVPN